MKRGALFALLAFVALALAGCGTAASADPPAASSSLPPIAAADYNKANALPCSTVNGHVEARAIPLYLSAIQKNGMYVNAYVGLAICYQNLGDFNGAIVEFDKAIQVDPMRFDLYIDRANAEAANGSTGQAAIDDYTALRLSPAQVASYQSIANSFMGFNNYAGAEAAMDKAIALVPSDPSLYEARAGIYLTAGDYGHAYQDYQKALNAATFAAAKASIYSSLAQVYAGQGNYPSAYQAISAAIALQPANPSYYVSAGDLHRAANDFAAALPLYDHALRLVSTGSTALAAHEGKGLALVGLGHYKQAIVEYRLALRLATDSGTRARLKGEIKAAQSGTS